MALPLENTFEGGTNGSTITTGGSGGASGDAFDAITSTPTWQTAGARRGAMGMQTTTGAQKQVSWNTTSLGSGLTTLYGRVYFQGSAIQGVRLVQGDGATTTDIHRIAWVTTTGKMQVNILGGTSVNSVNVVPINTWVRLEWQITLNGTTATVTLKLFLNPDSTVETETITQSAASTDATIAGCRIGAGSSVAATLSFDDFRVQGDTYPGPVKPPGLIMQNQGPRRQLATR